MSDDDLSFDLAAEKTSLNIQKINSINNSRHTFMQSPMKHELLPCDTSLLPPSQARLVQMKIHAPIPG